MIKLTVSTALRTQAYSSIWTGLINDGISCWWYKRTIYTCISVHLMGRRFMYLLLDFIFHL